MGKRKHQKHRKKHTEDLLEGMYVDMDENFSFIAGYTSGGAPYGVTWWEIGIDPDLPLDEKVRLYREQCKPEPVEGMEDLDLPF